MIILDLVAQLKLTRSAQYVNPVHIYIFNPGEYFGDQRKHSAIEESGSSSSKIKTALWNQAHNNSDSATPAFLPLHLGLKYWILLLQKFTPYNGWTHRRKELHVWPDLIPGLLTTRPKLPRSSLFRDRGSEQSWAVNLWNPRLADVVNFTKPTSRTEDFYSPSNCNHSYVIFGYQNK